MMRNNEKQVNLNKLEGLCQASVKYLYTMEDF